MQDLDRDLEQLGREISPDLDAARRRTGTRGRDAAGRSSGTRWWSRSPRTRSAAVGLATAAAAALALLTAVVLGHSGSGLTSPVAGAGSPGSGIPAAGAASEPSGGGVAVSGSSTAAVPQSIQPLQTVPPAGSGGTSAGSPRPPSAAAATGNRVVITEATGGPVTVRRGQEVEVDMSASAQAWSEPQSSNASVLVRIGGSMSGDGSAHALFRAVGDGGVTLFSTQAPPACYPRCLPPQRAFDVGVDVTG